MGPTTPPRSTVDGAGQVAEAAPLVYRVGLVDTTTPKGKKRWDALLHGQ